MMMNIQEATYTMVLEDFIEKLDPRICENQNQLLTNVAVKQLR